MKGGGEQGKEVHLKEGAKKKGGGADCQKANSEYVLRGRKQYLWARVHRETQNKSVKR